MKKTIIILHGWGLSGSRYKDLKKLLEQKNYSVYSPDMPGFGDERLKKNAMTIDDYVEFVATFMEKKKISKAYFIGHSFGGRVLAKLAVTYPELIEKIIFTGSPLIKQKLSLKKRTIQYAVKQSKKIVNYLPEELSEILRKGIYKVLGEYDYYKANEKKETFKNVIAEDGIVYISKIKQSTLLLWGEKDTMVPVSLAKKIVAQIPNSKLEIIEHAGHAVPYSHAKDFGQYVLEFFNT